MRRLLAQVAGDVRGATALEYGLIAALISIAIIVAAIAIGGSLLGVWDGVAVQTNR